jgi:hypothetical protein
MPSRVLVAIITFVLVASCACTAYAASVFELLPLHPPTTAAAMAAGWADFDNDGQLDLVATFKDGEVGLYRNDRGAFTNVGPRLGLPVRGDEVTAAAWGDYDGDGYPDLYIGTLGRSARGHTFLYHNEHGSRFVEVGKALGVDVPGISARQANWVDYDNDGDLDLFVANRTGTNHLFRNDGGHFTDVSKEAGLSASLQTVGACWFDMDQDGYLDLFLADQSGEPDKFYHNDGHGHFTDIAPQLRMDQPHRPATQGSVTCAVGDYDNDGKLDLFVAAYGTSRLYHNDGGGHFTEVGEKMGVAVTGHMVGASWGDYDNDGRLDLYVAGYTIDQRGVMHVKDYLFRNEGRRFRNVVGQYPILSRANHSVQWADFDNDGSLGVALADSRAQGGISVLRNRLSARQRRHSLQVLVLDRNGRHTRAGSEVRLYDSAGKLLGTRLVSTGSGYNSQSDQPVHFGLPRLTPVTVELTYLTSVGRRVQRISNIDPRKWVGKPIVVREGRP